MREVERRVPLEILAGDVVAGKVDLESGVPDPPNVSVDPVIRDCPGDIDPAEEILRDIVVVLDLDIQYPADLGVQTEIDHSGRLPGKTRIRHGGKRGPGHTDVRIGIIVGICPRGDRGVDPGVPGRAIGSLEFHHLQPVHIVERLLVDVPGSAYRPEPRPSLVLAERRVAVTAEVGGNIIP